MFQLRLCLSVLVIIMVVSTWSSVQCYNILAIFPHPGMSHWLFFRPIIEELVRRGHEVTLLSYFGLEDAQLKGRINYHEHLFKGAPALTNTRDLKNYKETRYWDILFGSKYIRGWGNTACDLILNNDRINEILDKEEKFDLIISEAFQTDCAMALAHKMNKIPVVGLSSCAMLPIFYHRLGMPDSPSYIPSFLLGFSEKMSFKERMISFVITRSQQFFHKFYHSYPENRMLREKFGKDFPDIRDLSMNMSLMLVNSHHSINGARPAPPNVLELAGVHVMGSTKQKLNKELKVLLENSNKGVILMSFGSVVRLSSLPQDKRDMLMKVFGQLDQAVIMKWENNTTPVENKPKNVHFLNWLPQQEILAHPNVKVFFSHGGMLGVVEALTNGVVVLGTPTSGDQFVNCAAVNNRKAGYRLNFKKWTEESLLAAVKTCLSQEYQDNAKLVSVYLAQRDPLALGVNAIENVIATKGLEFSRPYSTKMSWFTYYSVDVLLVFIASAVCVLGLGFFKWY